MIRFLKLTKKLGKRLKYEPLRNSPVIGLKTHPRTIRKDQDKQIRRIAEKTGRTMSEVVRDAIRIY